jgi:putative membrane protein
MPKNTLMIALMLALAQSPASAQQGPSLQMFAKEASISNTFELRAAELAVKRAKDPRVVSFAKDMLSDHRRASGDLVEAAKTDGIPVSAELDERRKKQLDALLSATDADFDQAYFSTQVIAHEEAVALFDAFGKSGNAGALKTFAQKTIGTLRMHDVRVHDLTDQ